MSFLMSVFLILARPSQLEGSALGPFSQDAEITVKTLSNIQPNPDSQSISAFQIVDSIGMRISCPAQIQVLSEIQQELQIQFQNGDQDEVQLEAYLGNLKEACSAETADQLPEDYDIRFFSDYLNSLLPQCEEQEAQLVLLKALASNVLKLERETTRSKEKGVRENIERFEDQIAHARALIHSVFANYTAACTQERS